VNQHVRQEGTNLKLRLVKLLEIDRVKVLHVMIFFLYLNGAEHFMQLLSSALEFPEQSFPDSFGIFT